ncbi:hypothetical protein TCON_2251 [Astathelohania contejeani]|uniref:Uncharacterized protein n=1 Tax=Astathelohania contejeani TaxID=164912 RepID=A0ABQ7HWI1_9MICR|nr:hypothetical protein TCON_2251 [Thelohania contejeani]
MKTNWLILFLLLLKIKNSDREGRSDINVIFIDPADLLGTIVTIDPWRVGLILPTKSYQNEIHIKKSIWLFHRITNHLPIFVLLLPDPWSCELDSLLKRYNLIKIKSGVVLYFKSFLSESLYKKEYMEFMPMILCNDDIKLFNLFIKCLSNHWCTITNERAYELYIARHDWSFNCLLANQDYNHTRRNIAIQKISKNKSMKDINIKNDNIIRKKINESKIKIDKDISMINMEKEKNNNINYELKIQQMKEVLNEDSKILSYEDKEGTYNNNKWSSLFKSLRFNENNEFYNKYWMCAFGIGALFGLYYWIFI